MIPSRGVGLETGMPFERKEGLASGRETPAVSQERSCISRGPEDYRRDFEVLEAAPRRLGSEGDSGGKRTESGEDALREPFGGVKVDGSRSFDCIRLGSLSSS